MSLNTRLTQYLHRYKLVRGAIDFGGVVNRMKKRSKYGGEFFCIAP